MTEARLAEIEERRARHLAAKDAMGAFTGNTNEWSEAQQAAYRTAQQAAIDAGGTYVSHAAADLDDLVAEVRRLRSFIESIRDNYDCDSDAHRYGTQCRVCEAARLLGGERQTVTKSIPVTTPDGKIWGGYLRAEGVDDPEEIVERDE